MPYVLCPMSYVLRPMSYALCPMSIIGPLLSTNYKHNAYARNILQSVL